MPSQTARERLRSGSFTVRTTTAGSRNGPPQRVQQWGIVSEIPGVGLRRPRPSLRIVTEGGGNRVPLWCSH